MSEIQCPKCREKESRMLWPISVSKEQRSYHVRICPNGHELPLFSRQTIEAVSLFSLCSF
jgi:hypothetical protein